MILTDEQHEFLESRAPQMLLRHQQRSMTSRRAAFSTAWPPWVYRQYDTVSLLDDVRPSPKCY